MIDTTKIKSQAGIAKLWQCSRAYVSQLVDKGKLNSIDIAGRKFVVLDQKFLNFKK